MPSLPSAPVDSHHVTITEALPGFSSPKLEKEYLVGSVSRYYPACEYGIASSGANGGLKNCVIETLAQRLFRLQADISDFLLEEHDEMRGVGKYAGSDKKNTDDDSNSRGVGGNFGSLSGRQKNDKQDGINALEQNYRRVTTLFLAMQDALGMRSIEKVLKNSLQEKLVSAYDIRNKDQTQHHHHRDDASERSSSKHAKVVQVKPRQKWVSDVKTDDFITLEKRVSQIETALGMYQNQEPDCPYPDVYAALRDCEDMYRALFLNKKNSAYARTTNFENSMQKVHKLLQIERQFHEATERISVFDSSLNEKVDLLYEMVNQKRYLDERDLLSAIEQRNTRLTDYFSQGRKWGPRISDCEANYTQLSQYTEEIQKKVAILSAQLGNSFSSRESPFGSRFTEIARKYRRPPQSP